MESSSSETSFTFQVDPVELCKEVPDLDTAETVLRNDVLTTENETDYWSPPVTFKGKFEDFSHRGDMNAKYLSWNIPGMLTAIHVAFQDHYALSLSVSDFIILIGQGLGAHINKNAEKLRTHFVDHEGKEKITIVRDHFVLGQQNDWSTVFGEFAEQIQKKVKADMYGIIADDTSVATATSRIVSEITLMDAVKAYFEYEVKTKCGIPHITLEGKPEDWQKLKDKVAKLVEMNKDDCLDLKWWLDELVPVVNKICEAGIERKVDKKFWSDIYKYNSMSGRDDITGWIIKFFPYVFKDERNSFDEIKTNMIPKQLREVPFIWNYLGSELPMKFTGGFLGAEFNEDLYQFKPAYFWCVTKDEDSKEKSGSYLRRFKDKMVTFYETIFK